MRTALRLGLLLSLGAALAWGADPLIGTWKLDLARSRFYPGPPPRSQTRTYEATPDGLKVTVVTTDARGKLTTVEFPAVYDGKTYPVIGPGPIDGLALEQVNSFQSRATLKHAGIVIATAERTLSENGTVLTISYREPGTEHPVNHVSVYTKQ